MTNVNPEFEALVAKAEAIKARGLNPTAIEYGDQLEKLLEAVANGRDAFVNWVAGLATATMLLTFQGLSNAISGYGLLLFLAGAASFICILFAFAFKILLEVRFSAKEQEVSLLRVLYEGHDIRADLEQMLKRNEEVPESEKVRLLRNSEESLLYLDKEHVAKLRRPIDKKSRLWAWSFWATLVSFAISISLVVAYYSCVLFHQLNAQAGA